MVLGGCALWLSACATAIAAEPTHTAPNGTAFVQTRVAVLLTQAHATAQTQATPTPTVPAATSATVRGVPSTVDPAAEPLSIHTALPTPLAAGPTTRPTRTPPATRTPTPSHTPSLTPTPCVNLTLPICAAANHQFVLARPVAAPALDYVERTYPYGSTQQGVREPHHGVEFFNPAGVAVRAAAPGTVMVAGPDDRVAYGPKTDFYGQLVVVQHAAWRGQALFTLYAHLSQINVRVGQQVQTGDLLGAVGQTGIAIGPHLHFEVRLGANTYLHTRNPELWLAPLTYGDTSLGALAGRVVDANGQPILGEKTIVIRAAQVDPKLPQRNYYPQTYAVETLNSYEGLGENFALGDMIPGVYQVSINIGKFQTQTVVVPPGGLGWVEFVVP